MRSRLVQLKTTRPVYSSDPHKRRSTSLRARSLAESPARDTKASFPRSHKQLSPHLVRETPERMVTFRPSKLSKFSSSVSTPAVAFRRTSRKSSTARFLEAVYTSRVGLLPYFFGPCQFRAVNVRMEFFRTRMHGRLKARCIAAFILISLGTFFMYAQLFTNHFVEYKRSIFFVMVGLVLDAVVIEPLFIFAKTLAAFSVFRFSNTEKYLYDENHVKLDMHKLPSLSYAQYIEQATKNRYKPLSSSQLDRKRFEQNVLRVLLWAFFYLCVLVVALCAHRQVQTHGVATSWLKIDAVQRLYRSPINVHGTPGIALANVTKPSMFTSYMTSTFLNFHKSWPSGRNISSNGMRWTNDRYSWAAGPVNFNLQVVHSTPRTTGVFSQNGLHDATPTVDELTATDFDKTLIKSPIALAGFDRYYKVTYDLESLRGKTKRTYYIEGHSWQIVVEPWVSLFGNLKKDLVDTFDAERLGKFNVPAIIVSQSFLIPYLPGLMTVDVIFEELESGLGAATVKASFAQVGSYMSKGKYPQWLSRLVISCLFICIFFANIYFISKVGITAYFSRTQFIIHALYAASVFLNAFSSGFLFYLKYHAMNQIADNPRDVYVDIHNIYLLSDLVDDGTSCFVFFMTVLEGALVLEWTLGREPFETSLACVRIVLALTVLLVASLQFYNVVYCEAGSLFPLTLYFVFNEFFPVSAENKVYSNGYIFIAIAIVFLLLRICSASVIGVHLSCQRASHLEKLSRCHHVTFWGLLFVMCPSRIRRLWATPVRNNGEITIQPLNPSTDRHNAMGKFDENINGKFFWAKS